MHGWTTSQGDTPVVLSYSPSNYPAGGVVKSWQLNWVALRGLIFIHKNAGDFPKKWAASKGSIRLPSHKPLSSTGKCLGGGPCEPSWLIIEGRGMVHRWILKRRRNSAGGKVVSEALSWRINNIFVYRFAVDTMLSTPHKHPRRTDSLFSRPRGVYLRPLSNPQSNIAQKHSRDPLIIY